MDLPKVPQQHAIDEQAKVIFWSHFNKGNGFLVQELPEDYGIDFLVELIDDQEQTSGICFNVQLKGTANPRITNNFVAISLKKTTLNLFSRQLYPTIIVVIDIDSKQGYWHNSFDFINELEERSPDWRSLPEETATIYIPLEQDFSSQKMTELKEYAINVHHRRNAVPQGHLALMQPFEVTEKTLSIEDVSKIVEAYDHEKFFEIVSSNPFFYLSDVNFSILFNLFEQIPPQKLKEKSTAMAVLSIAAYKKGYHQEARKWCRLSLGAKDLDIELAGHVDAILHEIDFLYGYISEEECAAALERISEQATPDLKANILLRQIMFNFWEKEKEARDYGRFRQKDLIRDTIVELWRFFELNQGPIGELALLQLGHCYSLLVTFLWGETTTTPLLRQKVGLEVTNAELESMLREANNVTREADRVFNILITESEDFNTSLDTKAEALLAYSIHIYQLSLNKHLSLVFLKEYVNIPEEIPLIGEERQQVESALQYCEKARDLFKTIGSMDGETRALAIILGFLEDLQQDVKYDEIKQQIEELLRIAWAPNTIKLFEQIVKEGSFRTALIKQIRHREQRTDFERADMSAVDIEMQVECNCRTFNITEEYRIENARKDVISSKLAARFRVDVCKHFLLLQDKRHSSSLKTLYTIDPNRKGVCRLLNHQSQFVHNDANVVINGFKRAYCKGCPHQEPLKRHD